MVVKIKNDEKHKSKSIKRPVSTAFHIHLTKRRRVWGISMEDFGVLWVWEFLWEWDGHGN